MLLVAWIFALYWTNSSAISLLPRAHANISGVLPNLSVYSMLAPSSINPRTQVSLFFSMANEMGVLPSWSIGSTSAPCPIIVRIEFREPLMAATWIGERIYSTSALNFILTSRPCSKNRFTLSSLSCSISRIRNYKWSNRKLASQVSHPLISLTSSLRHFSRCSRFLSF